MILKCMLLQILIQFVVSQEKYQIRFLRFQCDHTEYCSENATCSVEPVKRGISKLNFYSVLQKDIKTMKIRIITNYKYEEYRPLLIDITVDFCGFMGGADNPFMKGLFTLVKNYSTSLHKCPYKKGETMQIRDFILDTSPLPKALPSGQYRIDLICYDGKVTNYLVSHLYLTVKGLKSVKKIINKKSRN